MKLIVGLGNPGLRYRNTKHNAGFTAIDAFAKSYKAKWKAKKEWRSEVASIEIDGHDVLLVKPQTYMNASGDAVQLITHQEHIPSSDILIVHDDLDIDPGRFQFKSGGNPAGHNGIKDIYLKLGSETCSRLRIGIGRPTSPIPQDVWVLSRLSPKELPNLLDIISGMRDWIESGTEYAANHWNGQNQKTT